VSLKYNKNIKARFLFKSVDTSLETGVKDMHDSSIIHRLTSMWADLNMLQRTYRDCKS
jgi:hypothetical protein